MEGYALQTSCAISRRATFSAENLTRHEVLFQPITIKGACLWPSIIAVSRLSNAVKAEAPLPPRLTAADKSSQMSGTESHTIIRKRAAWADACNRALERIGRPERIDHRSYVRQGVQKIPTVHMGVAATQIERRGLVTEKGTINREITAQNRLLKEIKARGLHGSTTGRNSRPRSRSKSQAFGNSFNGRRTQFSPPPDMARLRPSKRAPLCSTFCRRTAFHPCRNFTRK